MSLKLSYPIVTAAVLAVGAITPFPAQAWNLICGVSINLMAAADGDRKWDADSFAIKGMGLYYLAVSDLQRLQLNSDGSVSNPAVMDGSEASSERAIKTLGESVEAYANALKIAEEVGLGDEKGLGLLNALLNQTKRLHGQLENGNLPELKEFHATTKAVMQYTQYGVELSNKHLRDGLEGHGEGGQKFKLE